MFYADPFFKLHLFFESTSKSSFLQQKPFVNVYVLPPSNSIFFYQVDSK